jgi:hypothetical protein
MAFIFGLHRQRSKIMNTSITEIAALAKKARERRVQNVVQFSNHRNLQKSLDETTNNLFFPVKLVAAEDVAPGFDCVGQQALIREDTNQIIKFHGANYSLVPNEEVFGHVDKLIRHQSGLDTNGMKIIDKLAYNGGRSYREYIFPEHQVRVTSGDNVPGVGDITELRISVINSYDGSSKVKVGVGGFRLVCLNGMTMGEKFGSFSSQHSKGFDPSSIAPRISCALTNFFEVGEKWKVWARTHVTDVDADRIILATAGKSESLYKQLHIFWHNEQMKMGSSLWALYNALTYWATHHQISEKSIGNSASIVSVREARVATVLRTKLFTEAA